MATLKDQLTQVTDWTGMERQSNQVCTLIAEKKMPGGWIYIFDFVSETGHPYDAKGQNVVCIEEDYCYIDNHYKNLF
jgi:hypothetical protein